MPCISMEYAGVEIANSNEDNTDINIKVSESYPECHFKCQVQLCNHR